MGKRIFYGVRSRVEETDNCTNTTTDIIIIYKIGDISAKNV